MKQVMGLLEGFNEGSGIADYWAIFNKIKSMMKNKKVSDKRRIRVAVLGSFTLDPIEPYLTVACLRIGLKLELFVGGFNQYNQELMNNSSEFHNFKPDITFIAINAADIIPKEHYSESSFYEDKKSNIINSVLNHFKSLSDLALKSSQIVVFHNFMVPHYSGYGIAGSKLKNNFKESIQLLNLKLNDEFRSISTVHILDYDSLCGFFGKVRVRNDKIFYLSRIEMSGDFLRELANEYCRYIIPFKSLTKKCIVLDLDNTLWGGVVGEDGVHGIRIGSEFPGNCFLDFQTQIKKMKDKGIALAINSKNNEEDALDVFRQRKEMILNEEDFVVKQINWNDKATNIRKIARMLNIDTDSIVFFDDNEAECLLVEQELPEVTTIHLPRDVTKYKSIFDSLPFFETFSITDTDIKKTQMFKENIQRAELKEKSGNIEDFLRNLNMTVIFDNTDEKSIERIYQLISKTNQFNLTTIRYSQKQLEIFMNSNDYILINIALEDKFGDNGITGFSIINTKEDIWYIDTFILSCRIIGRKIETALLSKIVDMAAKSNVMKIKGRINNTKKNIPSRNVYKDNGFTLINEDDEGSEWEFDISNSIICPDYLNIIDNIRR